MKHHGILSFILLTFTFLSCETEIPFDGPLSDPALTVNSLVCADSTIRVDLNASLFFLDNRSDFPKVSNASIDLFVNGTFKEQLVNAGEGAYYSNYVATEGDLIKLSVTAPGYPAAWSEATVPMAVSNFAVDTTLTKVDSTYIGSGWYTNGENGEYKMDTIGITYNRTLRYNVQFKNRANIKEYFRLVIYREMIYNGQAYSNEYKNDVEDLVFSNKKEGLEGLMEETGYDPYQVFTDELIDGVAHTISFTFTSSRNWYYDNRQNSEAYKSYQENLVIDVQSISKDYYLYLKTLKALGLSDSFMSEPVQIYTNIHQGLGLLGARTHQLRKIDLTK